MNDRRIQLPDSVRDDIQRLLAWITAIALLASVVTFLFSIVAAAPHPMWMTAAILMWISFVSLLLALLCFFAGLSIEVDQ